MKIKNVKTVNFRSIKDVTIDFDCYSCRTLVGINESGKTNILKALSYLDKNTKFDNKNIRQPLVDENIINESYVQFVFNIEDAEIVKLISAVSKKLLIDKKETNLFKINGIAVSINDFIKKFYAELSYRIDFIKKNRDFLLSEITEDILVNENIKMINKQKCPALYETAAIDGTTIKLSDYLLIDTAIYKDIPTQYVTEFDKKRLFNCIHNVRKEVIGQLPSVTYWEYKEKYLLPSIISLTDFIANPNSCIPLKNLFLLAGIDNISSELALVQPDRNKLKNLLSRIAKQGTNHFKKIWKEYKNVEFVLDPDGGNIIAAIKEENQYDMSQRSDGFKRFIAFLLIISIHVLKDNFKNTLLIVDEPEMGLHPSAVRDLRDELIKIAEHSNYVIFSTHSIFMVDNKHVERHIRVKKEKEITDMIFNNDSSFMDEEVIYNAMNYSVFETLRENNILFEGWRDKHLFEVFIGRRVLNEIGLCFAKGIKNIKNIAPMLQLANRKLIIVSDADNTAIQHKSEFIADQYYGIWYTYNDLSNNKYEVITAEDFLRTDFIERCMKNIIIEKEFVSLTSIELPNINIHKGKLSVIKDWLSRNNITSENQIQFINRLKEVLFNSLKVANIECFYKEFADSLLQAANDTE